MQRLAIRAHNLKVAGSNPASATIFVLLELSMCECKKKFALEIREVENGFIVGDSETYEEYVCEDMDSLGKLVKNLYYIFLEESQDDEEEEEDLEDDCIDEYDDEEIIDW